MVHVPADWLHLAVRWRRHTALHGSHGPKEALRIGALGAGQIHGNEFQLSRIRRSMRICEFALHHRPRGRSSKFGESGANPGFNSHSRIHPEAQFRIPRASGGEVAGCSGPMPCPYPRPLGKADLSPPPLPGGPLLRPRYGRVCLGILDEGETAAAGVPAEWASAVQVRVTFRLATIFFKKLDPFAVIVSTDFFFGGQRGRYASCPVYQALH